MSVTPTSVLRPTSFSCGIEGVNPNNAKTTFVQSEKGEYAKYSSDAITSAFFTSNGKFTVQMKNGEKYQIYGDPHGDLIVKDEQGRETRQRFADMTQTSTLELGDTKFTFEMTKDKDGKYWLGKATVTSGDYGATISGMAPDGVSKARFELKEYEGLGESLDAATDDGINYYEDKKSHGLLVNYKGNGVQASPQIVAQLEADAAKQKVNTALKQNGLTRDSSIKDGLNKADPGLGNGQAAGVLEGAGVKTVGDLLADKGIDISTMSWSAAVMLLLGMRADQQGEDIKKKAKAFADAPEKEREQAKVELTQATQFMDALTQMIKALSDTIKNTNRNLIPS